MQKASLTARHIVASTMLVPLRTKEAVKQDLWREALANLNAEDQKQYQDCSSNMLEVLRQVRDPPLSHEKLRYICPREIILCELISGLSIRSKKQPTTRKSCVFRKDGRSTETNRAKRSSSDMSSKRSLNG